MVLNKLFIPNLHKTCSRSKTSAQNCVWHYRDLPQIQKNPEDSWRESFCKCLDESCLCFLLDLLLLYYCHDHTVLLLILLILSLGILSYLCVCYQLPPFYLCTAVAVLSHNHTDKFLSVTPNQYRKTFSFAKRIEHNKTCTQITKAYQTQGIWNEPIL